MVTYDESDQSYQSNSNSMSSQSQKIKKTLCKKASRKRRRPLTGSDQPIQYNYQPGRPGKPGQMDEENLKQDIKEILSEQWFGMNFATHLLIFLCQKGNMIFKIKTGKPASINAGRVRQQLDADLQKKVKKFKKQFKKQLKLKHYGILEYLGYSEGTTYLFLQNNTYEKQSLNLPSDISFQTRQGLEIIQRFLSPEFLETYKLIIEQYYQNKEMIIHTIIEKLKENQENHCTIFNMQLIQELMIKDNEVMQSMVLMYLIQENSPSEAELHLIQKTSITIPNFDSRTFKDQKDAIFNQSNWIQGFLYQLFQILSAYP